MTWSIKSEEKLMALSTPVARTGLLSTSVLAYTRTADPGLLGLLLRHGVVLAGKKSVQIAARVRDADSSAPLLVDSALYADGSRPSEIAARPTQLTLRDRRRGSPASSLSMLTWCCVRRGSCVGETPTSYG
jgi:hypothetical protein